MGVIEPVTGFHERLRTARPGQARVRDPVRERELVDGFRRGERSGAAVFDGPLFGFKIAFESNGRRGRRSQFHQTLRFVVTKCRLVGTARDEGERRRAHFPH